MHSPLHWTRRQNSPEIQGNKIYRVQGEALGQRSVLGRSPHGCEKADWSSRAHRHARVRRGERVLSELCAPLEQSQLGDDSSLCKVSDVGIATVPGSSLKFSASGFLLVLVGPGRNCGLPFGGRKVNRSIFSVEMRKAPAGRRGDVYSQIRFHPHFRIIFSAPYLTFGKEGGHSFCLSHCEI